MDERHFTVIENEKSIEKPAKTIRQTNPIAKKFVDFHNEKSKKLSVKDLFKGVHS